jgi:DtxR family transcriptional regulator, Mn-dependent transcriptional regulator
MAGSPKGRSASTPVGTLSESLEDYLEIILQLQQQKRIARVRDIAARKGVSNASVSNALARLARDGFVVHEAHEFVELTERGAELARRVLRRHEFLISFLRDVLHVSPETAETDACAIEHQVSAETLERLASFYQFVYSCPKAGPGFLQAFAACSSGGPLNEPACSQCKIGTAWANDELDEGLVPLSSLTLGQTGVLVRMSVGSPDRERLVDAGLLPNVHVEVTRVAQDGRSMRVSAQGSQIEVDSLHAGSILVRRVGEP